MKTFLFGAMRHIRSGSLDSHLMHPAPPTGLRPQPAPQPASAPRTRRCGRSSGQRGRSSTTHPPER